MPDETPPTKDELKSALKAFKKRLKLTRLESESKIGRSPTTSGRDSAIVAIMPPNQFSHAVWEELAKQGKLRKSSQGTYELTEEN